jgi:hypothetical protein
LEHYTDPGRLKRKTKKVGPKIMSFSILLPYENGASTEGTGAFLIEWELGDI